jgi:hypothetical protein
MAPTRKLTDNQIRLAVRKYRGGATLVEDLYQRGVDMARLELKFPSVPVFQLERIIEGRVSGLV